MEGESEEMRDEGKVWEHLVFQQKWRMRVENRVETHAARAQCRGSSSSFARMERTMSSVSAAKTLSSIVVWWFCRKWI